MSQEEMLLEAAQTGSSEETLPGHYLYGQV